MSAQNVDKNLLLHLLTENELNHREIAERVGCSAERVRQLELKLLHRTGHEAQRERRERKLHASFDRNEFVKAAKRRGFIVEPSKGATRGWHKRQLYINGKLCLLRRAYENVGHKGWYTAIRNPWQRAEICVMKLGQGRFLIIPMKKCRADQTVIRLRIHPRHRKGGNDQREDLARQPKAGSFPPVSQLILGLLHFASGWKQ
jgi:sigma-70-like protein